MVVCSLYHSQFLGYRTLFFQLYLHFAATLLCTRITTLLCEVHIGLLALRIVLAVVVAHIDLTTWFVVLFAKGTGSSSSRVEKSATNFVLKFTPLPWWRFSLPWLNCKL
jgi:hypothetical protein